MHRRPTSSHGTGTPSSLWERGRFAIRSFRQSALARSLIYACIPLVVVGSIFAASFTPFTIFSSYGTFFATLEQVPLFVHFPVLSYAFAFGALAMGVLGTYLFLSWYALPRESKLFATVGAIAYAVNPLTQSLFREPGFALLWFMAVFPWLLFSYLYFLSRAPARFGKRFLFLLVVNILAFPAFPLLPPFLVYIGALILLGIGLLFSRYVYRIFWISPWLIVLILLVNTHWLVPLIAGSSSQPLSLLDLTALQPLPDLSEVPHAFWLPVGIAAFGLFRLRWFHPGFAVLAAGLLLPFLTFFARAAPPDSAAGIVLTVASALLPYRGLLFVPAAFVFAYFFAHGGSLLAAIGTRVVQRRNSRASHSLRERNARLLHLAREPHAFTKFAALPFIEGLREPHNRHQRKIAKQTSQLQRRLPRAIAFTLCLVLGVASPSLFTGQLIQPKHKIVYTEELRSLVEHLDNLPEDAPATFAHVSQPATFADRELKFALQSQDAERITAVLDKYMVRYLVLDRDTLPVRIQQALRDVKGLQTEKSAGGITVYKVNIQSLPRGLSFAVDLPNVGPAAEKTLHDVVFEAYGDYITTEALPYAAYYPFLDIESSEIRLNREETEFRQTLDQTLMKQLGQYELETGTEAAQLQLPAEDGSEHSILYSLYSEIVGDKLLLIMQTEPVRKLKKTDSGVLETNLPQGLGYLAGIDAGTEQAVYYRVEIGAKGAPNVYSRLQTRSDSLFLIPPITRGAAGHRIAISPAQFESLSIFYIPYDDILRTRFVSSEPADTTASVHTASYRRILGDAVLEITVPDAVSGPQAAALLFPRAYDRSWRLMTLDESRLPNWLPAELGKLIPFWHGASAGTHSRLNGWANAWQLHATSPNTPLYLVYWPLYATYAGWVVNGVMLLLGALFWIAGARRRRERP